MIEFKNYPGIDSQGAAIKLTIASGPVIIEDGKVLLDKHGDDNFWKFPGGRLPEDVSAREHAVAEVKQELGIDVRLKGEPFIVVFERDSAGVKEYVVLIHYLAERLSRDIKPGADIREWNWHDVKNLPADCAPNIRVVVGHFVK